MEDRKGSELRTEAYNFAQHAAVIENCRFLVLVPAHVFSSAVREAPQGTRYTEIEIKGYWDYRAPRFRVCLLPGASNSCGGSRTYQPERRVYFARRKSMSSPTP